MLSKHSGVVCVGGAQLEVARYTGVQCDTSRPAILMLHEGLGSVAMWKDFPQQLAEQTGRAVVAYSRAGYGKSSPAKLPRTARFMHEEGLEVLPALLDALALEKPILLGHSDGASIALIAAGGGQLALSGLVLMAPHIFVEPVTVRSIQKAQKAWQTTDLPARLGKYHDDVDAAFAGWSDIWLDPDFLRWNIEAYLPGIDSPVLAIQGEQDEYGSMAQIDGIKAQVPHAQLLKLSDCRHSPHKDQAVRVLAAITQFIH